MNLSTGGFEMTAIAFILSIAASVIAALFVGKTVSNKNKTRNNLNQKGNNNNAIQGSIINYNSPQKEKKEDN